jgi:hypothetical protein
MSIAFLLQMLKEVWRGRVALFWPIWITMSVAAAICAAWVVGRAATPTIQKAEKAPLRHTRTPQSVWPRSSVAALTLLVLFLMCYIALMLTWEDFAYYDDSYFTLFSLRGLNYTPPIWPLSGRFFPLCHQEFNLIRHFTSTIVGYHALPILQLLILSCILLNLDDELSIAARAGLAAFVLITPAIAVSYGGLIYPERNVVFWFACLVLLVKRFEQTRSTLWAVTATVCAQIMLYYKETAFLLLLAFAAGRLILRCWGRDEGVWDYNQLWEKESRLDLVLACLAMLFWLYYAAVMYPHSNIRYADALRLSLPEVCLSYVKLDLLAWVFVAAVLGRTWLILRRRVAPLLLWDGLALGGFACFIGYLCLGLSSLYYLAPVDVIAVLYLGRFAILSWTHKSLGSRLAIAVLLGAVLFQDVSLSAFYVFERKNVIHAKAEIARVVEARYRSGAASAQRIFFPFASPYVAMLFGAYLNYRGVPVEGATVESPGLNRIVMVGRAVARDGPCVPYTSLVCHAGSRPDPGDLAIVLPDDVASLAKVTPYRDRGQLLFSYEPRPRIPRWLCPFISRLRIASPLFAPFGPAIRGKLGQAELPCRWLDASVTVWK